MPGCIIRQGLWERFPLDMYKILSLLLCVLFCFLIFILPFLKCVIVYTSQDIPWIRFAVSFHKTAWVVSEAFTWCT